MESGKEAVNDSEAVMSSPGAREAGGWGYGAGVHSSGREKETSKAGALMTFTS